MVGNGGIAGSGLVRGRSTFVDHRTEGTVSRGHGDRPQNVRNPDPSHGPTVCGRTHTPPHFPTLKFWTLRLGGGHRGGAPRGKCSERGWHGARPWACGESPVVPILTSPPRPDPTRPRPVTPPPGGSATSPARSRPSRSPPPRSVPSLWRRRALHRRRARGRRPDAVALAADALVAVALCSPRSGTVALAAATLGAVALSAAALAAAALAAAARAAAALAAAGLTADALPTDAPGTHLACCARRLWSTPAADLARPLPTYPQGSAASPAHSPPPRSR